MEFVPKNLTGWVLLFVIYRRKKERVRQDFKAINLHSHVSVLFCFKVCSLLTIFP